MIHGMKPTTRYITLLLFTVPALVAAAPATTPTGKTLPVVTSAASSPATNPAPPSPDNNSVRIAAVVNDDVVSNLDLEERITLVIGTTGLQDTPETRAKLRPQLLRTLIDERLQMQEAARNDITVSQADIADAIGYLEKQRGKPPGSLREFLNAQGISATSFESQIRAQVGWARLIGKKVRPRIRISDTDVAEGQRLMAHKSAAGEVKIASILLPVAAPENEEDTKKLAEKLAAEITAGASFEAVASQFSATAPDSGSTEGFWVQPSQLDPAIADQIKKLQPGTVTAPVRTSSGWQIVKFIDKRQNALTPSQDAELALKQIILSLKPDATEAEGKLMLDIAKQVAKNPGSCTEENVAGLQNADFVNIETHLLRQKQSTLSPALQALVAPLSVGQTSAPFATAQGIQLMMLCEKMETEPAAPAPDAPLPDAEQVKRALLQDRLELEATKYMRNLRRDAFVDVRLK